MIAVTVKQLSAEIIGGFMPFMWTLFKYLQMRPSSISMQVSSELRSGLFANVCIQALTHRTHSCIALHNLWTTDAWLLSRNCQLSFTPQGFSDIININCYFFFIRYSSYLGNIIFAHHYLENGSLSLTEAKACDCLPICTVRKLDIYADVAKEAFFFFFRKK